MTGPGEGTTEPHSSDLVELANKVYAREEMRTMTDMVRDAVDYGFADDRDPMHFVVAELEELIEARVRQQIADAIEALYDREALAGHDYCAGIEAAARIARGDTT